MRTPNQKVSGVTKLDLNTIKTKLEAIHKTGQIIHISVNSGRTKAVDVPSKISGIYNHFICVTANVKNYIDESFTINFIDIIMGKFVIKELLEEEI
jgi:uncharacterized protein Veg